MKNQRHEEFLNAYEPVHPAFERFCRARVYGDMDYEDLMNETLIVAFEKFSSLRTPDSFLSFLIGISIRILANHSKKRKEIIGNGLDVDIPDTSMNAEVWTDVHFLHKALRMLEDNQRECLILFEITGFSIKEIAAIQDSSESAIKQRLRRARMRLKEILVEQTENKSLAHG